MTWAIAPDAAPSRNATTLPLKAEAPIHAPTIAGRAGDQPEADEARDRRAVLRERARRTASPSVVLWTAKPITSSAPSASAPAA